MEEIGVVVSFYVHPSVAAIKITKGVLKTGDTIKIEGHTTNLEQVVESIQIEHETIQEAKPGDDIGIKVKERMRPHDKIYKL